MGRSSVFKGQYFISANKEVEAIILVVEMMSIEITEQSII